jgi:hypothetical protein
LHRRNLTLPLALSAALLALVVAPALAGTGPFSGLRSSAATQHGSFHGTLSVRHFNLQRGRLGAEVVLRGTVHDTRYPQDVTFHQPAQIPVSLSVSGCRVAVSIGPTRTYVWGLPASLRASRAVVSGNPGCKLRSAHGAGAQAQALERLRRSRG